MRRLIVAAVLTSVSFAAEAADVPDLPILRGPVGETCCSTVVNWQGPYVGGHYSYGASQLNLTNATQSLTARMLYSTALENEGRVSDLPVLGKTSSIAGGFGGFAGYTGQWDDVILGVEASYTRGKYGGSATGSIGRIIDTSNGYTNNVTYTSTAGLNLTDMGSLRARAGYAFSAFLPYAFIGPAFGVGDVTRFARVSGTQINLAAPPAFQNIPFNLSASDSQGGRFIYGFTVGVGLDVMLIGGLFGRFEYEYMKFAHPIDTSNNTVKAGLGYKF